LLSLLAKETKLELVDSMKPGAQVLMYSLMQAGTYMSDLWQLLVSKTLTQLLSQNSARNWYMVV